MSDDPNERTVYVKNLDGRVDTEILEELFVQVGSVVSVFIKEHATPEQKSQQQNGQSARYAFVEFQDEESVLFAIEMLDKVELFGCQLMILPRDKTRNAEKFRFLQQKRNSSDYVCHDLRAISYMGQVGVNSNSRDYNHLWHLGNDGKHHGSSDKLPVYRGGMQPSGRLRNVSLGSSPSMLPLSTFQVPNSNSSIRIHQNIGWEQRKSLGYCVSTPTNHRRHSDQSGR